MKKAKCLLILLTIIGLVVFSLTSTVTFAIDHTIAPGVSPPATLTFICPSTVVVSRTETVKYSPDPEWQPSLGFYREFASQIRGAQVEGGKIKCVYSFPYPEDQAGGTTRLQRDIPQGYTCEKLTTRAGAICIRQARFRMK